MKAHQASPPGGLVAFRGPRLNATPPSADHVGVSAERAVFHAGMADTRAVLADWRRRPAPVLGAWMALSVAVALALLVVVSAIAGASTPDPSGYEIPGVTRPASGMDVYQVLGRNGLVLALHAMACVAGFMAGSSLPQLAESRRGLSRWIHEKAGPLAIGFVAAATAFSLTTQAYALGRGTATLAAQLHTGPATLLRVLSLHALPELTALFLPLAAWLLASRRGAWRELLAATYVTVAIAVPMLVVSAYIEVFVTPRLLAGFV